MLKNFRTFHQAVNFYRQVAGLRMPTHLKDQLLRAASSVPLNLAEGAANLLPAINVDFSKFLWVHFEKAKLYSC